MANLDGTDAFFDSRDVIERIAEIESETIFTEDKRGELYPVFSDPLIESEYVSLIALQEEAEGYVPDWQYGETFYTRDALVEYVEETVNDCYTTGDLPSWVTNHIDWEAVAEEIKVDYTEFEFRGTTYYAR